MDNRQMICDFCRKSVPLSDIKYMPKGDSKMALCPECRAKKTTLDPPSKKQVPNKKQYLCQRCSYKFRFNPNSVSNLRCPYCGKADQVVELEQASAGNLVKQC
jgi:DNA-directed RNA polymerase subunit RPC12/RpoP